MGSDLIEACKKGDIETIKSLLKAGADPKQADGDGDTALHWASIMNGSGIVRLLLKAGGS